MIYSYNGFKYKFNPRRDPALQDIVENGSKVLNLVETDLNPNFNQKVIKNPISYIEALSLGNTRRTKVNSKGGRYTTKSKYKDVIMSQVEFHRTVNYFFAQEEAMTLDHILHVLSSGSLPKIINYFEKFQDYLVNYYNMNYYWVWYDQVLHGGNFKEPSALGDRGGSIPHKR